MTTTPRVTIGLPVHNGEAYLAQAIQSILGQTYRDFELIISDNASTDRTQEICESFASFDPRIRYIRQPRNMGAAPNFNACFTAAAGELFRWHAHDDWIEPEYLAECVRALDDNPEAVLCQTRVRRVDHDGKHRETVVPFDDVELGSAHRFRRFRSRARNRRCLEVFGLFRTSAVRLDPPIGSYIGMDRVLLYDLAFSGPFVLVNKLLFVHREHRGRSVRVPDRQAQAVVYDARNVDRVVLSAWQMYRESLGVIFRRAHRPKMRVRCCWYLAGTLLRQWNWAHLALDPVLAVVPGANAAVRRLRRPLRRHQEA